jgi:signal transduction histidine kinase/ActR/RegA family two-component response regulator
VLSELQETIVRAFPDPCLVTNAAGSVLAANKAAMSALGGPTGPLDLTTLVVDAASVLDYLRLCARSPDPLPGGLRIRAMGARPEHSYRCYGSLLAPRDGQRGALILVRFAQRDANDPFIRLNQTIAQLTEENRRRKEAEETLRSLANELRIARDRAEENVRVKDEFLATLSHELRTPLNAIVGWSRMLQGDGLTPERRVQALETIHRNALAQNHLVDDLLDVSRIISGKFRMDVDDVDINRIVSDAADVVRAAADAKSIQLRVLYSPDAGQMLGDAARLQQVFWNLLVNAIKFTPRGGRVHVSIRRKDSAIEVEVADSGVGIADEFLSHVFERFTQASHTATTRTAGGLGLGLAIVKHIVEAHGGIVSARSDGQDRGAAFVVALPVLPVRASPPPADARSSDRSSARTARPRELDGLHVLVIEDDSDARELAKVVLEDCEAIVSTAGSVEEAFAILRQERRPDVIVSDIGMPGEDGYDFIRRLRELPREQGGRIPALALTAFAKAEDRHRALVAGFQNHAAKPIEPQELVVVVANLAGRFP